MKKIFVRQFYPGSFVANTDDVEIENKDTFTPSDNAFGYRFFEREYSHADNGETLMGKPKNWTPMTYIGRKRSIDDVAQKEGTSSILYSNMKINKWSHVVQTRFGQCFDLGDRDVVIEVLGVKEGEK